MKACRNRRSGCFKEQTERWAGEKGGMEKWKQVCKELLVQTPAHNVGEIRPQWEQLDVVGRRMNNVADAVIFLHQQQQQKHSAGVILCNFFIPLPLFSLCDMPDVWALQNKAGNGFPLEKKQKTKQEQILTLLQVEPLAGRDPWDMHFLKNLIRTRAFLINVTHKEQSFCCAVISLHLSQSDSATT